MATKTRDELRELVRTQLDMDDQELPDSLLDPWLQEGYEQTLAIEDRWPFLEAQWDITTVADQVGYLKTDLASAHTSSYEVDKIVNLLDITSTPFQLLALSHDEAEVTFGLGANGGGTPEYWSEWGGYINLWQAPEVSRTVRVRGFRKPAWLTGDAVAVDADSRLHVPIYFYAVGMAYGQQEDEILKAEWMQEWNRTIRRAHDSIMAAPQRRPLILSGARTGFSPSPVWDVS